MGIERFIEVIVRAFLERHGAFHRLPYLCEQDNGYPVALTAQAAQYFPSVEAGHQHIPHHQIGVTLCNLLESLFAIAGDDYLEACPFKEGGQVSGDGGFVIYEKDLWVGSHRQTSNQGK